MILQNIGKGYCSLCLKNNLNGLVLRKARFLKSVAGVKQHVSITEALGKHGEKDGQDEYSKVATPSVRQKIGLFAKISKARLTGLVTLTASGGYLIAPGIVDPTLFVATTVGTFLCSASANSLNQFLEVPYDCQMARTKDRVLVRGQLRPSTVVIFGSLSGILGVSTLASLVNPLTAALGALNIFLYAGVYTPSKRVHIANTWIGSVVGAIPPLMGWAAATGSLDLASLTIAGILYSWQFPHFNALSWSYRADYSRAGYKMMSVTNPALCRRVTFRHGFAQIPLSILIPYLGVTNWLFLPLSLPFNGYMALLSWQFYRNSNANTARKLFRFTLLHLPILMFLLVICKKRDNKALILEDDT